MSLDDDNKSGFFNNYVKQIFPFYYNLEGILSQRAGIIVSLVWVLLTIKKEEE